MRYKFIILFLLIGFVSKAQVYQLMPQYGYTTFRMNFDSTIQIPTFCGVPRLGSNVTKKGAIAFDSCNNRFYYFNPKFQSWDTIKTADASLFVKYTDTSTMLNAYLRKADTTNKFVNSVVKVNDSTFRVFKGATSTDITLVGNTGIATKLTTTAYNKSGALIPKGSVVYIDGAHSSLYPSIALAKANNEETSAYTYGLVENDISNNSLGVVVQVGSITNLNLPTSSFTDGQTLYLSPTVAGGYTTTKPLAPNHYVAIGTVIRAHPNFGTIQIAIRNGFQLDEMSDVKISLVPLDSTILQFSRVDSLWHDVDPTTAMGNRFVKRTDSAAMLLPYLRKIDTASISNRINLKLNISDTSAMLSPYMRTNTANASYVTSVFRKTASDSVFFVRGGTNNFAFRDSLATATPASPTNSIQYNNAGSLGGSSNLVWDNTNQRIGIGTNTPSANIDILGSIGSNGVVLGNIRNTNSTGESALTIRNDINEYGALEIFGSNWVTPSIRSKVALTSSTPQGFDILCYNNSLNANFSVKTGLSGIEKFRIFNSGNVLIQDGGTYTDIASARVAINSTTQGFLQPRLTTTQMNAISTPATGLSVFNTTDSSVYIRRGTSAGWQQVANEIFASATLDFPNTLTQTSSDLTITLTGAVDGDAVVLGVPNAAVNSNSNYFAWVSATNTVTVRFNNYGLLAINPASATFKVTIIK